MIERRPTALDDGINLETIQSNGYNRKESAALKEYGARTESSALKRPSEPQSMRGFSSGEVPKAANDPGWLFRKDCLDRKLKRQHITGQCQFRIGSENYVPNIAKESPSQALSALAYL